MPSMNLDHPVVSSLLPVVLLIFIGFIAGRAKLVRPEAVRDLSNLVFLVLTQAMLFRTMSSVHLERLELRPVFQYFAVGAALFFAMLLAYGRDSRASVLALAGIFSNTLMIGVPLIGLAYGQEGLVLLFTLISLHALVLLTLATLVLELQMAHEQAAETGEQRHMLRTVWQAVRSAIVHPVPMPIIAGLLYAQTGWGLHPVVDKPLVLLGNAFGPVALVLGAEGKNRHVQAHVDEGLRLARRYRLPRPLADFIPEHQGTLKMGYFLHEARRRNPEVAESEFRYRGPIPRSRETAVLMLADGCEAALRSLPPDTSEAQARSMVRRIVDARWQDGQLANSGLSLAELELLVRAFVRVWRRMRHRRIPYPIPARKGFSA